jgi:hypothetical protein
VWCDSVCLSGMAAPLGSLRVPYPLSSSVGARAYACGCTVRTCLPCPVLRFARLPAWNPQKEKRKRDMGRSERGKSYVEGLWSPFHPLPSSAIAMAYQWDSRAISCMRWSGRPGDRTVSVATLCLCLLGRGEAASTAERNGLTASWKQLFACVYELCWA